MRLHPLLAVLLTIHLLGCSTRGGAARNPGAPTPVEPPGPGPAPARSPQGSPGTQGTGGLPAHAAVPVRPAQAPLVRIREVLEADSLLGRRVRVSGRCTAAGVGRTAGSWTLEAGGDTIEVRGLVPSSCTQASGDELTIFAQIEPKSPGSRERLLLRLPE